MSASHGYSTMGGIEYDGRGKYGEDKKVESLTPARLTKGLWRCPSIDTVEDSKLRKGKSAYNPWAPISH